MSEDTLQVDKNKPKKDEAASIVSEQEARIAASLVGNGKEPISNMWSLSIYIGNESSAPIRLKFRDIALIGRNDAAENFLPQLDLGAWGGRDLGVSRRHAEFQIINGVLHICDLASINGTFVNGVKLAPNEPFPVTNGDKIECGNLRMIIYIS
jgi:pSer/pThr/pTyr-binding forkhead associated (FHA) protein